MKPVKVCIGIPSYKGPHRDVFAAHYELMAYLGRLQERSHWMNAGFGENGADAVTRYLETLPPLDQFAQDPDSELRPGDPPFQFFVADLVGYSLIGLARDQIIKRALANNCDYVFFFDDDMAFPRSLFLKLWRHQKEFVCALAFTSREPISPVLYRFYEDWDPQNMRTKVWSEPIFDYPKEQLFRVDGTGTGVVLIKTDVFRKLQEPWFHGSMPTVGEDVYFSLRCKQAGIPIFCDSSAKTIHVPNELSYWMDESRYEERKDLTRRWWAQERAPHFQEQRA